VYVQAVKTVLSPKWGRGYQNYLRVVAGVRHPLGNYRKLVDGWAEYVEPEHVHVRPFESSVPGAALHRDLLQTMGRPEAAAALPAEMPRQNESVSFEAVNFIDIVTHTRMPEAAKAYLAGRMLREDTGSQRRVAYLSPAERLAQVEAHAADYEYIARTFLGRPDGRLFEDPLPDPAEPWTPPTQPSAMWLVERMGEFLSDADPTLLIQLKEALAVSAAGAETASAS
jgi:hypothetical protein